MSLSRRQFLIRSGWIGGGLTLVTSCGFVPPLPTFDGPAPEDAALWVSLQPDGRVRFLLPRAEMGQGISTGLSRVVAAELKLPVTEVDCIYQDTANMAPCQFTVGSQSVENYLDLTARAAAGLREVLADRAATALSVPADSLERIRGGFRASDNRTIDDRELASDEVIHTDASELAHVTLIGVTDDTRDLVRGEELISGTACFSRDVVVPGMHFGGIARPPQLGAKLDHADRDAALQVEGVVAVSDGPADEIGIVAETPMALAAGLAALDCRWVALSEGELAHVQTVLDIDTMSSLIDHKPIDEGSVDRARQTSASVQSFRYDTPMVAHGSMEPRSGVARIEDGQCEVWTGSQDPWMVRAVVARATGLREDRVRVHGCRLGGGFGGRVLCQASVEAAWLAKAAGVPVKVQWSREEEFAYNYVGPQFSTRIEAGLSEDGDITFVDHSMLGSPILISSMFIPDNLHWAADLVGDPGTQRGTESGYSFTNHRVRFGDVRLPMATGAWRGLGAAPNTFAVECAMDELALAADADPFEFRVRHAADPRLAAVIRRLATLVPTGEPIGMAAAAYKGVTFVAVAAAVSADGRSVEHLWCVHDCGRMIAPDQVLAQVEGNLVWGIGMALTESFELEGGIASTSNFDHYQLPRQLDMPAFTIELTESDANPSGAGEAAFAPAAAAIANAAYRRTGMRHRQLPIRLA